MFKKISVITLLATAFFLLPIHKTYAQDDQTMAETVVHLLSYVAMDYPGAVQNGEIIDEQEFKEQQEFSEQAIALTKEASFVTGETKANLLGQMEELLKRVNEKQPDDKISKIATEVNDRIIKLTGLETAPKIWPTISNGKQLYQQNCAVCHGTTGKGDGPGSVGLDPTPSNFHDEDLAENFSPYQAYNSIRLGVPGTAMQPFSSHFNELELWDLAFYVKSIYYQKGQEDSLELQQAFNDILPEIGLSNVANLTDKELLDSIKAVSNDRAELKLKALRTMIPTGKDAGNSLPTAREGLQEALKSYTEGNKKMARTHAISAYLEGIEPVEARLRNIDAGFVVDLETQMFNVRQVIEKDKGTEAVKTEIDKANKIIDQADDMLKGQQLDYWVTFVIALSIMLREALEAFLVLFIVLALIRSAGAKKALPWLHGGWITAVICGVIGWFLADYIIQFGGKNREIMEGLVSLFAVLVLIFAGFWLHDKTYAKKWNEFVNEKIGGYLKKDRMFGLAAFSFMVVFREAFEVILFLQALNIEADAANKSAIGFGALGALVIIAIIAYFFMKTTKRIPIKYIFKYSAWLIVLLAVILMGKGFHSLQEAGWVSVTNWSFIPRIEWLGLYSTLQTVLAQLALIVVITIAYFINKQKHQKDLLESA